ncbi:uncharacterized protein PgNI_09476 [Pyricularia grisea]|uniref:Uncharacterized protein n=1 Tax=Pyricularia grisea TaxID=148305 RepID=A0A6P8ASQ7_PYRGI|nr:uncharacterized protein PgNI_09476 [Pyricularia grisea]TLD05159.1 hypothetical protein PgNI_09476 [Pyricularia grisea]
MSAKSPGLRKTTPGASLATAGAYLSKCDKEQNEEHPFSGDSEFESDSSEKPDGLTMDERVEKASSWDPFAQLSRNLRNYPVVDVVGRYTVDGKHYILLLDGTEMEEYMRVTDMYGPEQTVYTYKEIDDQNITTAVNAARNQVIQNQE